jgi:cell wall-associated NlpC family hydrolase
MAVLVGMPLVAATPVKARPSTAPKPVVRKKAPAPAAKKTAPTTRKKTARRVRRPAGPRAVPPAELQRQKALLEAINQHPKSAEANILWQASTDFFQAPYRLGQATPKATDCSGFTASIYKALGYPMPRTAGEQFRGGMPVEREQLQFGDLVFFGNPRTNYVTHVGLYVGENRMMHASGTWRRVRIDSLDSRYANTKYLGARRMLAAPVPEVSFDTAAFDFQEWTSGGIDTSGENEPR